MTAAADRWLPALTRVAVLAVLLAYLTIAAAGADSGDTSEIGHFDEALAARVFTAAFTFMAPRTLEPVTLPQMTIWGLRGISALDPHLTPVMSDRDVTLSISPGHVLTVRPLPSADDMAGWGALVASVSASAFRHSETLQRAGTQGVITSFFDEVFNHLDPYSRYVAPAAAAADQASREGQGGIGVTLAGRPGYLTIGAIIPGSPAQLAGMRPGERLIAIDDAPLARTDASAALDRLHGAEGSDIRITLRAASGRSRTLLLQRKLVPADTVTGRRQGDLLILEIAGFTASTADRLRSELDHALARRPQPRGVVIDLRGNRGGLLREAVAVADLMLTAGPIATTAGRNPQANHSWAAEGVDAADGLPVVVLVDGRSASAAEVLAAALSDDARAVVVGSATLGKGLVQTVGPMPDGGALFVTWSRVLAPSGWPLQGLGVMPQVCTSLGQDETRRQLDALTQGTQPMGPVLARHRAARPTLPLAEMLILRDACPAALGSDSDLETAAALIANPIAYATALGPG